MFYLDGEVESRARFESRLEPRVGEVPEEDRIVRKLLGPVFLPWLEEEVEGGTVVEVHVEGAA